VILQVAWCCRMNKCGLMTAGVFMVVSGILSLVFTVVYVTWAVISWAIVMVIGAGFYIASAVCIFVFLCGPRYERCQQQKESGADQDVEQGTQVVSEIPTAIEIKQIDQDEAAVSLMVADVTVAKSLNKTIYHLPDGRIKTVTEVTLSDGTKQVTTTIEQPEL
jgi:hypothetical protein